jgi:acetyl esterase/lipase
MFEKKYFCCLLFIMFLQQLHAQKVIPLYPGSIPNSIPGDDKEILTTNDKAVQLLSNISHPKLTLFLPKNNTQKHAAVVICPGGGYWVNAVNIEGYDEAKQLNEWGIAAFVLTYRIPDSTTCIDPSIAPLQDAQQAMLMVRMHAKEWNIDTGKIGVMGFSAGGHLASTLGTHFEKVLVPNENNISVKPDFMMLIYPVISSDSNIMHKGSFEKLLGKHASDSALKYYSNELQVTANTPPTFLVHASDDDGVSPLNSIRFYEALLRNHVPAELHIYQNGGHGFGMHLPVKDEQWMQRLKHWLMLNKIIQ